MDCRTTEAARHLMAAGVILLGDVAARGSRNLFRLLLGRLPLPFPLRDRRAKPGQHHFQFGHGAAQHRQHGFRIQNRASGPDIDDIGHQAGPGCSVLAVPFRTPSIIAGGVAVAGVSRLWSRVPVLGGCWRLDSS
jgi:hypothetical protein